MPKRVNCPGIGWRRPADLYADLERWAARELRSVNARIEYLLRQQVRRHKGENDRPAE